MRRIGTIWCKRLLLLVLITTAALSWAQGPGQESESFAGTADAEPNANRGVVTPPEVYARLMFLQSELDHIRFEMGKPKPIKGGIEVTQVAPREVYFQAVTLFKKSNRLSFEHTREIAEALPQPDGTIGPADVMAATESSLARISHVKIHLEITQSSAQPAPDKSKTPTDVFRAIMQTNRQLNLLLDQPFSPAEVYEQVTLAIGYTARLRAQFPGDRIPETSPFVRGKRPADVHRKLIHCFVIIRHIAAQSELPMLTLNTQEQNSVEVTPSDVYDIATLLVSELAYLWSQLDNAVPPRPAYYPGRRFPSHVYQRASLLERQLAELAELVDTTPAWLTRK